MKGKVQRVHETFLEQAQRGHEAFLERVCKSLPNRRVTLRENPRKTISTSSGAIGYYKWYENQTLGTRVNKDVRFPKGVGL